MLKPIDDMKRVLDLFTRCNPRCKVLSIWSILFALILASVTLFYRAEKEKAFLHLKNDVKDISEIKIKQFVDWHNDRLADLRMFSESPFLTSAISSWVDKQSDNNLKQNIEKRLDLINTTKSYTNIIITSLEGKILINLGEVIDSLDSSTLRFVEKIANGDNFFFTNFYPCNTHKTLHIDYLAPIKNESNQITSVIIFRINPYQSIYPILEEWHTQIETAQNFIFRADADTVIFLNSIWEKPFLDFSIEGQGGITSIKNGLFGFNKAMNKQSKELFVYVSSIEGTLWFFVKVIDYKEFYKYLSVSLITIILFTILLITFLSFAMLAYYYYLRKSDYVKKLVGERKVSSYYKEFQTILYSIADGVITTDVNGCVTKMNFVAEKLMGVKEEDAFSLSIYEIVDSQDCIENLVRDVIGKQQALSIECDISRDIAESGVVHISINASPIFDEHDEIQGAVLIVHDKTVENATSKRIAESEARYRMLFNNMTQGFALHSIILDENDNPKDYKFIDINKAFEELTGLERDKVIGHSVLELMPSTEKYWIDSYGEVALNGSPIRFENYSAELDRYYDVWAFCPQIGQFAVIFSDITERRKAEEEVRQKNEFIQTVLDNLPIGIALNKINEGDATYMNKKFEEIYGWGKDDLRCINTFFEKVYPEKEYRDRLIEQIVTDINSGDPERMKWNNIIVTRKDGVQRMVNAVNIPLLAQNTMVSTVMDITEIKLAEEAAREGEELFRSMFYDSFSVMLIIDPITRALVDVNQSAERFYGWSKGEMLKMRIDDINTLPTDKLEFEINNVLNQRRAIFDFQHRIKGGEKRDVEVVCSRITIKGKHFLHSIVYDITERKKAEEQVVKLKKGIEQSPAIVIIADINGNVEYVNPKFVEVTGYSVEEVLGKNPRILKSGYHPDEVYKIMWDTILAGSDWKGELLNKKKNGDLYWESTSISPIRNENGKIKYFIAVKEDITERKQIELELYERDLKLKEQNQEYQAINEELTESNERIRAINKELIFAREIAEENDRLKSAFLANMSHELRTPMNGIIGFAELLKRPQMTDEDRISYTKIIEQSGQRLLELINNLIDISKIESGQVKAIINTVEVSTELNHLYSFFRLEAENKGLCLILNGGKELPELSLATDKQKFISVITNLIKNAIKFTSKGTIDFGFDIGQDDVEFWVSDTGMGIPKKFQNRIFERFVQGDTSLSRPYEGAGLGLAISKSYVELLGGKIYFESEEGSGTSFFFTLPLSKSKKYNKKGYNDSKEIEITNKNLTVLIAEDDKYSMAYLRSLMEPYVKKIYMAETGQKALDIARAKQNIDLILMDVRLPDINGLDVTRTIREFNPSVKIIAQSAFALPEDKLAAKKVGCNDYVVKPIIPNDLYQSIINCFGGNNASRPLNIKNL